MPILDDAVDDERLAFGLGAGAGSGAAVVAPSIGAGALLCFGHGVLCAVDHHRKAIINCFPAASPQTRSFAASGIFQS